MSRSDEIIALEEHFIVPKEEQNLPPGAHRGNDREKLLGFGYRCRVARSGRCAHCRHGCRRNRLAGAFAQPARLPGARCRTRPSQWRGRSTICLFEAIKASARRASRVFAALPTADPGAAVKELDRAVTRLGFNGAMINGHTRGSFLDDTKFWPIFECAAGAASADLPAPDQAASCGAEGLFRRLRGACACRLGLRHRYRRAFSAPRVCRRVRRFSRSDVHPRTPRRGLAVHAAPDQ